MWIVEGLVIGGLPALVLGAVWWSCRAIYFAYDAGANAVAGLVWKDIARRLPESPRNQQTADTKKRLETERFDAYSAAIKGNQKQQILLRKMERWKRASELSWKAMIGLGISVWLILAFKQR